MSLFTFPLVCSLAILFTMRGITDDLKFKMMLPLTMYAVVLHVVAAISVTDDVLLLKSSSFCKPRDKISNLGKSRGI